MQVLSQEITSFTSSNITESTTIWSNSIITAGAFVVGKTYTIVSVGTTNFTLIGAASNTIGVSFTATGIGAGTGTVQVSYVVGDLVLLGTFIYKCVSPNTDKTPEEFTGIYWVKHLVSNKWAMLDLSAQSKSYFDGGNLTVEFLQGGISTLAIGNYEAEYVKVEILNAVNAVIWTYNTPSSLNADVVDWWTYMYSSYGYSVDRAVKIDLGAAGTTIRVTLYKSANSTRTACGYLVGGSPFSMGDTLDQVSFSFNSFASKVSDDFGTLTIVKRAVQDLIDFETIVPREDTMVTRRKVKEVYNDIVVFIVDESTTSEYENMLILGVIETANLVTSNIKFSTFSWSIFEAI